MGIVDKKNWGPVADKKRKQNMNEEKKQENIQGS